MTRSTTLTRRPLIVRRKLTPRITATVLIDHKSRCATCRKARLGRFAKLIARAELTRARNRHRGR